MSRAHIKPFFPRPSHLDDSGDESDIVEVVKSGGPVSPVKIEPNTKIPQLPTPKREVVQKVPKVEPKSEPKSPQAAPSPPSTIAPSPPSTAVSPSPPTAVPSPPSTAPPVEPTS